MPSFTKSLSLVLFVLLSGSTLSRCQQPQSASAPHPLLVADNRAATEIKTAPAPATAAAVPGTPVVAPAATTAPAAEPPAAAAPTQPASLFDPKTNRWLTISASVEVHGDVKELETSAPQPFVAGGQDVISMAGAFGDISRFLQVLPGVIAPNDLSNEVMVRGGHPMENLFLVDGIEVPNINHIATLGTTGGFGPMIDAGVVQGLTVFTGGYDARYPERLSSVIAVQTLDPPSLTKHAEADLGIEGFGGLVETPLHGSDLLASAHRGLLELMDGAGLDGLPSYTNELARFRHRDDSGNRLTVLHLGGWDSVANEPCPSYALETSSILSQYAGWRETTGVEWQHVSSRNSFAVANISDSEQIEHIHQQDTLIDPTVIVNSGVRCPVPASISKPVPVYMEDSNNAFSSAGFHYEWSAPRLALSAGSAFWLERPHYQIDQPLGAYSPYSVAPVRADSTSFASDFSVGESGSYAQVSAHPVKSMVFSAGGRVQTFAFGNHLTLTPRLSMRYNLTESVGVHLAFASYAQFPTYVYMIAYPQNRTMLPMRSTHEVIGMDLGFMRSSQIHIEAYNKVYRDVPASTEYPSVNLHDMVDMFGQQFVWLPMNSGSRGNSSGIEISDITQIRSKLVVRGSVAYSRAMFAGLDHIPHPSNFDFPWIVNAAALERFGRGYEISLRYGYATGRPYTPYDLPDSLAQNRPIYDVSQMNALRVPYFGRMDTQLTKDLKAFRCHLEIYAGVNNVLNRANFLAYVWMPRAEADKNIKSPAEEIHQMPIFPMGGLRYIFR